MNHHQKASSLAFFRCSYVALEFHLGSVSFFFGESVMQISYQKILKSAVCYDSFVSGWLILPKPRDVYLFGPGDWGLLPNPGSHQF